MTREANLRNLLVILLCFIIGVFERSVAAPSLRKNKQCGLGVQRQAGDREGKIVGGSIASKGEFPWMVSFKSKHGHFCGGSVISDSYIMSAAHCFHPTQNQYLDYGKDGSVNLKSLNVTLGEYSLKNNNEDSEVAMNLKQIYLHPKYDPINKQNDIALIKIAESLAVAPAVVPVCLPDKSDDSLWKKDAVATVVGWGKTSYNQDYYDWLQQVDEVRKVNVKIWEKQACIDKYKNLPKFPSNSFLCAGSNGKESCTGDSGGPLLRLDENNNWVVIGIVANGYKCADFGKPGVYTLVSDFLTWIDSYTN